MPSRQVHGEADVGAGGAGEGLSFNDPPLPCVALFTVLLSLWDQAHTLHILPCSSDQVVKPGASWPLLCPRVLEVPEMWSTAWLNTRNGE